MNTFQLNEASKCVCNQGQIFQNNSMHLICLHIPCNMYYNSCIDYYVMCIATVLIQYKANIPCKAISTF